MGYKTVTDFYYAVGDERLDINDIIAEYEAVERKAAESAEIRSAEEFQLVKEEDDNTDDVLVIGDNIKGINYRLAKCCNPIFGDDVFGFISAEGVRRSSPTA